MDREEIALGGGLGELFGYYLGKQTSVHIPSSSSGENKELDDEGQSGGSDSRQQCGDSAVQAEVGGYLCASVRQPWVVVGDAVFMVD
jgi:hypothetical protein